MYYSFYIILNNFYNINMSTLQQKADGTLDKEYRYADMEKLKAIDEDVYNKMNTVWEKCVANGNDMNYTTYFPWELFTKQIIFQVLMVAMNVILVLKQ